MKTSAQLFLRRAVALVGVVSFAASAWAIDPPHKTVNMCGDCHMPHLGSGATLTSVAGNGNLCMSCHTIGGTASSHPFVSADQALPWPGLPAGTSPAGSSHRWDSGAAGHLQFLGGAATPSTGAIRPTGAYTGVYAKTYNIQITTSGAVGVATFNWSATTPGGGSGANVLTATNSPLDSGVFLNFTDGTNVSFQTGDVWNLFVRPDLNNPSNTNLLMHMENGMATCSACHNEHSEELQPFDASAQPYITNATGLVSGTNRHFMRIANDQHQMCNDCHSARNVTNSAAGSHPVGINFAADLKHKLPTALPTEAGSGDTVCLTCHRVHNAPDADGKTLRMTNSVALCNDCHTLSDTTSAHFSTANAATLWPGGKFGSLMPARTDPNDRGSCLNCHAVHGWPTNSATSTIHYEHLLADYQENFCYTCHGANGPATKLVYADFQRAYRHPVANNDTQRRGGRTVECSDCHNAHKAGTGSHIYTTTATATRNALANTPSLRGVDGVSFNYTGLTNFQAVTTNRFTYVPATTGAAYEYQICFKCHTSYYWKTGTPPTGTSPNGTAVNPVETDVAQEFSPMNKSGHPIMTGLDNYPNSVAVSGKKGLLAAAMKAPWNVNVGQQTMLCSDCHDSTTTNSVATAAQGPHGSAFQYMLRGPNGANWPNVTLRNIATSWCMNCHNNAAGRPHTTGDHSGYPCYNCHIVIPHGGKVSRLLAANNGGSLPARYTYNNTISNARLTGVTKSATGSYNEDTSCGGCGEHNTANGNERW
ncbi:MAG TPA: hypothetical protein VK327_06575 [Candidatus Paceibacterota bacterium]|nr:hypothetical protein [Candidatus Paceibacterota bacterium]